ncbi:putative vimentin [Escherichia coli]|uniref:Putative vimentin n=1 Tax=Escherichia coli TaxID=562 RepID=A0A376TN21_ECOLX|nr:putative vimentin [Escherichia coli]
MKPGNRICKKCLTSSWHAPRRVLAVLDYTQLKSISDEEVREAILAVGQSVPLYVLVNKFDHRIVTVTTPTRCGH